MKESYFADVADFVSGLTYEALPVAVAEQAKWRLLEALGRLFCATGHGKIVGGPEIVPALSALTNGAMLAETYSEQDDQGDFLRIDAAIVPAALAMIGASRGDGRALICALVAGYAATARLGFGRLPLSRQGWHIALADGTLGAAAAAANASRLGQAATRAALGFASSQASQAVPNVVGVPSIERPGKAAMDGVLATAMAEQGAACPPRILERIAQDLAAFQGDALMMAAWYPATTISRFMTAAMSIQTFRMKVGPQLSSVKTSAIIELVQGLDMASPNELMSGLGAEQ